MEEPQYENIRKTVKLPHIWEVFPKHFPQAIKPNTTASNQPPTTKITNLHIRSTPEYYHQNLLYYNNTNQKYTNNTPVITQQQNKNKYKQQILQNANKTLQNYSFGKINN